MKVWNQRLVYYLFLLWVGVSFNSCIKSEKSSKESEVESTSIDLIQARKEIEAIDRQFSLDIKNKDSVALADHYASDGTFGSIKGRDKLIAAWGRIIRGYEKNGTQNVIFITNSLSTDNEFIAELGVARLLDADDNIKNEGKYLVVWKKENGEWKLYRDMGL
jgi:ketosteroid isomerase-like protein